MFTWHILFLDFWSSFVWSLFLTTPKKLYVNTNFMGNQSWNTNYELVSNIDVENDGKKPCIFKAIFFFFVWVFFHEHSRFTGQQGKGEGIYLTLFYHFHPLRRHLDISRVVTAESSPQHIASSRTWTGNLWFLIASCYPLS